MKKALRSGQICSKKKDNKKQGEKGDPMYQHLVKTSPKNVKLATYRAVFRIRFQRIKYVDPDP